MYSRLGDPEALNVLAMLRQTSSTSSSYRERRLSKLKLEFTSEDAVVVKSSLLMDIRKTGQSQGHPVQVFEQTSNETAAATFSGEARPAKKTAK